LAARGGGREGRRPSERRRTPLSRVLLSIIGTFAIAGLLVAGVALWGLKAVHDPGPLSAPKTVIIEEGRRTPEIAALLKREGVIDNETLFTIGAYLSRSTGGNLKPGEYEFATGQSMADALALIRSGRAVMHKLTIPEGWTSEQALKRIEEHPALAGSVGATPAEGSLLPDTYLFRRGYTRQALIAQMRAAQTKLMDELWEERATTLPFTSKEEAIVLASIVEKETAIASERPQVAAVFLNRLKKRMRLQSDPTIIYGIVGGQGRLDRPIRRSDIETRTDYNTYRIDGLPPGPIANPGRESIVAVLNPVESDSLYFVADGTGGHVFASTLAEHQQNVRKWRQVERDRRENEETAETEQPAGERASNGGEKVAASQQSAAADPVDTPAADPAGTDEAPQVAVPADPEKAAEAEPEAAEAPPSPNPLPVEAPEASKSETQSQSGDLVRLANRLVPIPKPKPKRN